MAISQTALGNAAACATQTKKVQAVDVARLQAVVPAANETNQTEARAAAEMAAADERDFYLTLDECAAVSWT